MKFLTKPEAAVYLNRPESWVAYAVQFRVLPYYRVGRGLRFAHEELDLWLAQRRVAAADEIGCPSGRGA